MKSEVNNQTMVQQERFENWNVCPILAEYGSCPICGSLSDWDVSKEEDE